jgi:hypothetical protein
MLHVSLIGLWNVWRLQSIASFTSGCALAAVPVAFDGKEQIGNAGLYLLLRSQSNRIFVIRITGG